MVKSRMAKKQLEKPETEIEVVPKKKEDIRLKFNKFINDVIEKGKTSSIRFDTKFMKELEEAGKEARMKSAKPVKIVESPILNKPAITQALNLGSDLELAATKDVKWNVEKWIKRGN